VNDETFTIEKLPDNWNDMSEWDQYWYIGEHGKYIGSDSNFSQVDDVYSVETEEEVKA
jgi:hypothetical protein